MSPQRDCLPRSDAEEEKQSPSRPIDLFLTGRMLTVNLSEDQREVLSPSSSTTNSHASPQAFESLQSTYNGHRNKHRSVLAQLGLVERERKRNTLTLNELEALPTNTNTYKAIGKMFLMVRICWGWW